MEVTLDAADDRTPATNGKLAAAPLVTRRARRVTAAEHPRPQLRGRSLRGTSSAGMGLRWLRRFCWRSG